MELCFFKTSGKHISQGLPFGFIYFTEKFNNLIVWIWHDEYRNNVFCPLEKVLKNIAAGSFEKVRDIKMPVLKLTDP